MPTRYPQAILVSCEIPWDDRETLLEDSFRQEIRAMLTRNFSHLYIFGTAGEGYAVTLSQFQEIVRVFHDETQGDGVFPMVGVIAMSTPQVVERVGFAYDLGIRAFQIALPPWGALHDDEYVRFFKDVCETFPDARFIHYNLPRAKRVLLGPDYRRLVEAVPNLCGTKNCRTDICDVVSIATHSPELQHFYGEHGFPTGCLFGECSLLSSFGALFPSKTKEFFHYGVTGQFDKLFRTQADYIRVMDAFLEPTLGRECIDGAYDKMIVRASGIDMPLRLLSPYEGFDEETYLACVRTVQERYPDWLE
jgi:dihydrodipicolinate synthase/N-acetylneuraminate lyase